MSRLPFSSYLFLSSAAVLLVTAAEASAQTCATAPSCSELGYVMTEDQCSGKPRVYCPFDKTKLFCANGLSCERMGYTMTTTQCSGRKYVICPFDGNKVVCDTGALVGEIRLWPTATAPKGWKICDGSSLSSSTYSALYAVIGTTYGGNSTNFYLPNLKGRVPVGVGYATSSTYTYSLGSKGGEEKHTLTVSEMPSHNHGYTGIVGTGYPDGSKDSTTAGYVYSYPRQSQLKSAGSGTAHENRMPYLALNYIIYTGVY